jgi:hypothetical protein
MPAGLFSSAPRLSGCKIDLRLDGGCPWTHRRSARIVGAANSACLVTVPRESSVSTVDIVFARPRRDRHGRRCKHRRPSRTSRRSRGGELQSAPTPSGDLPALIGRAFLLERSAQLRIDYPAASTGGHPPPGDAPPSPLGRPAGFGTHPAGLFAPLSFALVLKIFMQHVRS